MGSQPHDRLGAEARRMSKRRTINGQFTMRPIEMLRAPVMRVLSLTGRRILDRIEIEHATRRKGKRATAGHSRRLSRVRH